MTLTVRHVYDEGDHSLVRATSSEGRGVLLRLAKTPWDCTLRPGDLLMQAPPEWREQNLFPSWRLLESKVDANVVVVWAAIPVCSTIDDGEDSE